MKRRCTQRFATVGAQGLQICSATLGAHRQRLRMMFDRLGRIVFQEAFGRGTRELLGTLSFTSTVKFTWATTVEQVPSTSPTYKADQWLMPWTFSIHWQWLVDEVQTIRVSLGLKSTWWCLPLRFQIELLHRQWHWESLSQSKSLPKCQNPITLDLAQNGCPPFHVWPSFKPLGTVVNYDLWLFHHRDTHWPRLTIALGTHS